MFHGHLGNAITFHFDQGRQESVHAFEKLNTVKTFAAKSFQTTTRIGNGFLGKSIADTIGNATGNQTNPIVLAFNANAANAIDLIIHTAHKGFNIIGIVLQISIHGNNKSAARQTNPRIHGCGLTLIGYKMYHSKIGMSG